MYIDTHAHLNYNELKKDLQDILKRAFDSGVEKIIVPATDYKSSLEITELVQKYEMLFGAVGIHPTELKDFEESQLGEIENLAMEKKIVAIGEIGLDYYWEPYDKELQNRVLYSQIQIAKRCNLPVILHNRNSSEDLIRIVENEYDNRTLKAQFHSFSGDIEMAKKCFDMGFYISFTGNITYKPRVDTFIAYEIVKACPDDRLLLETDTPYLPPVPYRGKKNEPAFIKHTAQKIAELKSITIDELAVKTTNNAEKFFNI
jgi:TatD DNase family protein